MTNSIALHASTKKIAAKMIIMEMHNLKMHGKTFFHLLEHDIYITKMYINLNDPVYMNVGIKNKENSNVTSLINFSTQCSAAWQLRTSVGGGELVCFFFRSGSNRIQRYP